MGRMYKQVLIHRGCVYREQVWQTNSSTMKIPRTIIIPLLISCQTSNNVYYYNLSTQAMHDEMCIYQITA